MRVRVGGGLGGFDNQWFFPSSFSFFWTSRGDCNLIYYEIWSTYATLYRACVSYIVFQGCASSCALHSLEDRYDGPSTEYSVGSLYRERRFSCDMKRERMHREQGKGGLASIWFMLSIGELRTRDQGTEAAWLAATESYTPTLSHFRTSNRPPDQERISLPRYPYRGIYLEKVVVSCLSGPTLSTLNDWGKSWNAGGSERKLPYLSEGLRANLTREAWNEMKWNEMKWNEIKWNQMKSDQIDNCNANSVCGISLPSGNCLTLHVNDTACFKCFISRRNPGDNEGKCIFSSIDC